MSTKVWNQLFESANESLQEKLWQAAIRVVADAVLLKQGIKPETEYEIDDGYEDEREGLIGDWMGESLPRHHTLIEWLDGPEFFEGNGSAWVEEVCLTGDACPCIDDMHESLYLRSDSSHAHEHDISKEMLEDFYRDWRASFLGRVEREAKMISSSD